MLHMIAECCDAWIQKKVFREMHELKDNSLQKLIDSENTGKHL